MWQLPEICYLLKQNLLRTQYGKIPPPRVNSTEVTNEPTDWNDIIEHEETEDYESTTLQKNYNTFDVNSGKITIGHRSKNQPTEGRILWNPLHAKETAKD